MLNEDQQKAKELLQEYYYSRIEEKRLEKKIEELKEVVYGIQGMDYSKDRVQFTPENKKVRLDELLQLELELVNLKESKTSKIVRVMNLIDDATSGIVNLVLKERYCEGKRFSNIAKFCQYTERQIYRFHCDGLSFVAKKIEKKP